MVRSLDWVDRIAGVDNLGNDEWLDGKWVLYPVGPWIVWPWWRRLLDWFRAEVLAPPLAALIALHYWITVNPSGQWSEPDTEELVKIPASWVYGSMRGKWSIRHSYCGACDSPNHTHSAAMRAR